MEKIETNPNLIGVKMERSEGRKVEYNVWTENVAYAFLRRGIAMDTFNDEQLIAFFNSGANAAWVADEAEGKHEDRPMAEAADAKEVELTNS